MTWIRASFARIHGSTDGASQPKGRTPEALAGHAPRLACLDTRERWRVSTQIGRLAWGFVIAFARHPIAWRPGFLLKCLSILRVAVVNDGATGRWLTRGFAVH